MTSHTDSPSPSRAGPYYIAGLAVFSVVLGAVAWRYGRHPDPAPLLLLSAMGILSFNLREPTVTSRIGFSFLSIILLASAAILGPFGAWCVGVLSQAIERDPKVKWFQRVFNIAMTGIIGLVGAGVYLAVGGAQDLEQVSGFGGLALQVGAPLIVADVMQCLTNAVLLSGAITLFQGVPFWVFVRRVLVSSGVAYVGYGVIGFLFVVLWFPVDLGAFSALLIMAPLLAARWAFIQYGEEMRSHQRTIDTLVTALGTKEPAAVSRSRRAARVAEWIAEELGLGPRQIETVRYAATLYEIGHLAVPTRLLRRAPEALSAAEQRLLDRHCVIGARMIEGIDFLEDARSGIRHQRERADGQGRPDGLSGESIPVAARIVAAVVAVEELFAARAETSDMSGIDLRAGLRSDPGRLDPHVVDAVATALDKHGWPAAPTLEAVS